MFMPGYDKTDIHAEMINPKELKVSVKSDKKKKCLIIPMSLVARNTKSDIFI